MVLPIPAYELSSGKCCLEKLYQIKTFQFFVENSTFGNLWTSVREDKIADIFLSHRCF